MNVSLLRTAAMPRLVLGIVLACAALSVSPVWAQEPAEASGSVVEGSGAPAATPYSQQELSERGFRPADSTRPGDTISGGALLLAAYALFWGAVVVYVVYLVRLQAATTAQLAQLSARLDDVDRTLRRAEGESR